MAADHAQRALLRILVGDHRRREVAHACAASRVARVRARRRRANRSHRVRRGRRPPGIRRSPAAARSGDRPPRRRAPARRGRRRRSAHRRARARRRASAIRGLRAAASAPGGAASVRRGIRRPLRSSGVRRRWLSAAPACRRACSRRSLPCTASAARFSSRSTRLRCCSSSASSSRAGQREDLEVFVVVGDDALRDAGGAFEQFAILRRGAVVAFAGFGDRRRTGGARDGRGAGTARRRSARPSRTAAPGAHTRGARGRASRGSGTAIRTAGRPGRSRRSRRAPSCVWSGSRPRRRAPSVSCSRIASARQPAPASARAYGSGPIALQQRGDADDFRRAQFAARRRVGRGARSTGARAARGCVPSRQACSMARRSSEAFHRVDIGGIGIGACVRRRGGVRCARPLAALPARRAASARSRRRRAAC